MAATATTAAAAQMQRNTKKSTFGISSPDGEITETESATEAALQHWKSNFGFRQFGAIQIIHFV